MSHEIAEPGHGLAALLEWDEPLAVGFYPDLAARQSLMEQVRALVANRNIEEVTGVDEALALVSGSTTSSGDEVPSSPSRLIVIEPHSEPEAVAALDQNRDQFASKGVQVLLLLLRNGTGERALADAPQLASFARSASFEVPSEPDKSEAVKDFATRHGSSPQEWLEKWRRGELPDTTENNMILSDAIALEDARDG